jgi:hypothetical protein
MKRSHYKDSNLQAASFVWVLREVKVEVAEIANRTKPALQFAPLLPLRQWLESFPIQSPKTARRVCQLIPAQCPFERTIKLFGRPILHIPPLCKLNPVYEELVALRFRALCYLADECGEDVLHYC